MFNILNSCRFVKSRNKPSPGIAPDGGGSRPQARAGKRVPLNLWTDHDSRHPLQGSVKPVISPETIAALRRHNIAEALHDALSDEGKT